MKFLLSSLVPLSLQAEYQISRDQQKLRVARELQEFDDVELDDEAKLQE